MAKNLLTAALLWLCLLTSAHAAPLVLGVVPYMSARKLANLYEPLRAELERSLQQAVTLESAADYGLFLERTRQGRYDIIATSPYFGRLAQQEQDYQPLARPLTDLEPLLVSRLDGIRELAQLRGQTVSTSDRLANLTLAAQRYLQQAGFHPGRDIAIHPTGSHANSLAALLGGESAAAIVSVTALHQFGGDIGGKIHILARLPHTTPQLYLGHKRLGSARLARLQQQLLTFANDTPQGRAFSRNLNHGGLRPVSTQDMRALDPYVRDLKGLLR